MELLLGSAGAIGGLITSHTIEPTGEDLIPCKYTLGAHNAPAPDVPILIPRQCLLAAGESADTTLPDGRSRRRPVGAPVCRRLTVSRCCFVLFFNSPEQAEVLVDIATVLRVCLQRSK